MAESLVALRRVATGTRNELAARFSPVEWAMLACLVLVPVALVWRFASPSFFFFDDISRLYDAHASGVEWSYLFASSGGHLAPGFRLVFLLLDRVAPMNFEAALTILVACHAVSTVLLQRILTLLFGRFWWTYALALAWAISVIYLPSFAWFAAGLHEIPAITATLASIHGYLCWRATGRRGWLAWSLVAMCVGLTFYVKVLLVPLYLLLMRILLLDPGAPLGAALRSVRDEWRVWLAYATVCAIFLLAYSLGSYTEPQSVALSETLRYLSVFWFDGFWPTVFGVRVPPFGHSDAQQVAIVGAQVALVGLVAWSISRRRAAWRAWAFLLVVVLVNALFVVTRVAAFGGEAVAHELRYYTDAALAVPLAIAFAFTAPRLRARVAAVEAAAPAEATSRWFGYRELAAEETGFHLPTARLGAAALVALTAYLGVTWATTDSFSKPWLNQPSNTRIPSGRLARMYVENLRADLAAIRRAGVEPSLLDHNVPTWVMPPLANLDPAALRKGLRYTLLSSVVPLFDERVTFDRPGHLYIVRPDGHLQPTRFVPKGGPLVELQRSGRVRLQSAKLESRGDESCFLATGSNSLIEWVPNLALFGRDWWLHANYSSTPAEPIDVEANAGLGWGPQSSKLPAMQDRGTAILDLNELPPPAVPAIGGVRLHLPPFGRLCLGSLEIGYLDPPVQTPPTSP